MKITKARERSQAGKKPHLQSVLIHLVAPISETTSCQAPPESEVAVRVRKISKLQLKALLGALPGHSPQPFSGTEPRSVSSCKPNSRLKLCRKDARALGT